MELLAKLLLTLTVLLTLGDQSAAEPRRTVRQADGINWNEVVDNLISQFRQQIREEGRDSVPLPPINEEFTKKILVTLKVKFDASGGNLSSVTSVYRSGNATLNTSTSPPTLSVPLRFGDLRLRYQHYHARAIGLGARGKIEATLKENSFLVRARVKAGTGGECVLDYEDVHMVELKGFKVKMKGLFILNKLASFIASRVTEKMRHGIASSLQQMLDSELRDIFGNVILDCSQFASAWGIDVRGGETMRK